MFGLPKSKYNCESLPTEIGNNHNEVCIVG